MTRTPPIRMALLALVGALAMAFAALGAGHATPRASDPAYEAYLLGGGAMGDLCPAGPLESAAHTCPVCTLIGKIALPSSPTPTHQARGGYTVVSAHPAIRMAPLRVTAPYAARGPPVRI
ncbi:hypothetical protein [Falsirhodobacter halotolerans]|uniref:hypothetical protein n=1 Tax=Falsirhodobacter halotolerans TaxID=1146892 RepID=UPI001FCFCF7C|nr:hypothetical protein [Falsirhodobacter halotolerans]MCJ8139845.1 hypothetical protein [Falsirhodobacter halotolerans]